MYLLEVLHHRFLDSLEYFECLRCNQILIYWHPLAQLIWSAPSMESREQFRWPANLLQGEVTWSPSLFMLDSCNIQTLSGRYVGIWDITGIWAWQMKHRTHGIPKLFWISGQKPGKIPYCIPDVNRCPCSGGWTGTTDHCELQQEPSGH